VQSDKTEGVGSAEQESTSDKQAVGPVASISQEASICPTSAPKDDVATQPVKAERVNSDQTESTSQANHTQEDSPASKASANKDVLVVQPVNVECASSVETESTCHKQACEPVASIIHQDPSKPQLPTLSRDIVLQPEVKKETLSNIQPQERPTYGPWEDLWCGSQTWVCELQADKLLLDPVREANLAKSNEIGMLCLAPDGEVFCYYPVAPPQGVDEDADYAQLLLSSRRAPLRGICASPTVPQALSFHFATNDAAEKTAVSSYVQEPALLAFFESVKEANSCASAVAEAASAPILQETLPAIVEFAAAQTLDLQPAIASFGDLVS